jgi:thymidylate kinase
VRDDTLKLLDNAVEGRALVFGSLPPEARDLDLLVRPDEERALTSALREAGFEAKGSSWARFGGCEAEAVDLVPTARWRLAPDEIDALFDEAEPLPGHARLVRPAPAHTLLILARLLGRRGLPEKRRARFEEAARAPGAWAEAHRRADAWGVTAQLDELAAGAPAKRVPPRPKRGHVIALSGLDGAGKSTQARHLAAALEALGHEAVVIWTPLASNPGLKRISGPARTLLGLLARRGLGGEVARRSVEGESLVAVQDAGHGGRGKTAITLAWATVVALANAASQARRAAPQLARGRIVIFDRYVLDSSVHLRYLYGEQHGFRIQEGLVRLLSPRPLRAYFLDAEPASVAARKNLQYDLGQLQSQIDLYRAHCERLGVRRIDGELPLEEICRELARDVWLALPQ